MVKTWIVYKHISPSGKIYVGITSKSNPNDRWNNGKNYVACKHFYNAIIKYGWDNFQHIIINSGLAEKVAKDLERKLIKDYKKLGISYNITTGGDGHSVDHLTESHKKKISIAHKGKKLSKEHRSRIGRKGRIISQTTKHKMSVSNKGKKKPIELVESLRKHNTGLKRTEKHKEAIRKAHSKAVLQIKPDGTIIEFASAMEAERVTGVFHNSINKCCHLVIKSAGGYKWKFKNGTEQ